MTGECCSDRAGLTLGGRLVWTIVVLGLFLSAGSGQVVPRSTERVGAVLNALALDLLHDDTLPRKCGTPFFVLATAGWQQLSPSARGEIAASFARGQMQKNRLSPSGNFRIHYDTTGVHTPLLLDASNEPVPNSHEAFVDSAAKYFDYCWTIMIDSMGYGVPMQDGVVGGGPEYDVYIEELGSDIFGLTTFEGEGIGEGLHKRFTSFITIDNDFRSVRTRGMDGLRVVAAHEFYHAIQLGAYGAWGRGSNPTDFSRDFYFYELSAVWMEDVLFPEVNDYLFDLPAYFTAFSDFMGRSLSFTTFSLIYQGYERAVWAHYLTKRFGPDLLRSTWEAIRDAPFLESMDRVLRSRSRGFQEEYATFSLWNYFTGTRADTVHYYPEGHLYPLLRVNAATFYNPTGTATLTFGGYPLSTQFCQFSGPSDSVLSVVANVDVEGAMTSAGSVKPFELRLSNTTPSIPYQNLKNGMKAGFTAETMTVWRVLHIASASNTNASVSPGPFPNPVYTSEVSYVVLPVTTTAQEAEVFLVSSSFDLVFSRTYPVRDQLGNRYVYLPTGDFRSSVNSGIYFLVVHCPDVEYRWKIAVIR